MMTKDSFNDMLLSMQGNMLNFALILTSDRNAAYTLLQQATLRALEEADAYNGNPDNFKPWVFAIMRRISDKTEYDTQPVAQIKPERIKQLAVAATDDDIPEECISVDKINVMINGIDNDTTRRVVTMHLTGWTASDITVETGVSISRVINHIRHGMRHILNRIASF